MTGLMAERHATCRLVSPLCLKLVSLCQGQLRCTRVCKESLALTVAVQAAAASLLPVDLRVGSSA